MSFSDLGTIYKAIYYVLFGEENYVILAIKENILVGLKINTGIVVVGRLFNLRVNFFLYTVVLTLVSLTLVGG